MLSGQIISSEILLEVIDCFIPGPKKEFASFFTIAFRFHIHALKAQLNDAVIGVEFHILSTGNVLPPVTWAFEKQPQAKTSISK